MPSSFSMPSQPPRSIPKKTLTSNYARHVSEDLREFPQKSAISISQSESEKRPQASTMVFPLVRRTSTVSLGRNRWDAVRNMSTRFFVGKKSSCSSEFDSTFLSSFQEETRGNDPTNREERRASSKKRDRWQPFRRQSRIFVAKNRKQGSGRVDTSTARRESISPENDPTKNRMPDDSAILHEVPPSTNLSPVVTDIASKSQLGGDPGPLPQRKAVKPAMRFSSFEESASCILSQDLSDATPRVDRQDSWVSQRFKATVERASQFTSALEDKSMRLDGLDAYTLIGALVSTTSFSDIGDGASGETSGALPQIGRYIALMASVLATLLGLYSTIVFASTVLYGKTAMGMGRERMYHHFMDETKDQRVQAFNALLTSVIFFAVEVCLKVADTLPNQSSVLPFLLLVGTMVGVGVNEFKVILKSAGPIFTNVLPGDTVHGKQQIK